MTQEEFYSGLPEALGAGTEEDFQPTVEFKKLAWWDSLVYLRLLDYLETATGKVFPNSELEACKTWDDLANKVR